MKFRKIPVVIEAVQFTNETKDQVYNFVTCNKSASFDGGTSNPTLKIQTLEGVMTASVGDWIIKGVNGEFCICKPDIFKMTYEPAICGKEMPDVPNVNNEDAGYNTLRDRL